MRVPSALMICAALLMSCSCSRTPPPGPKIDPALMGLIPPDTTLLAGVRLEDIRKTDLYKKNLDQVPVPPIDRFAEQTGIDPRKDLSELLLVSNGKQSALIGHGMFPNESESRLEKLGGKQFTYKGFNLVGNDQTATLLVSQTVLAAGETPELRSMVDAHQTSGGPPPAMVELFKEIPGDQAQIWAAYDGGPAKLDLPEGGNLSNVNKILQSIQSGTFYLDLRMGMTGLVAGTFASEKDAQDLSGAIKAFIGLGRLSAPNDQPDLQRFWDGLRVTQEARIVRTHIDVPEEIVEKTVSIWLARTQPSPPPPKRP
jgi:hypothetical protein